MSDLDRLKSLLFGAEKEALDSITERVERREIRTADVADILPEAIYQSHNKNAELVESLSEPVGECLQRVFQEDPETYGNALYPVIGPAIRKSIMHALRNFAQQINAAVEHSVSPTGLKWRWQASRAGIPFGEFILQRTMQYRVEQAYLISRENGLLMGHVHHEASKIKDSDAVSAMFTAIQDFVKESFSPDRTGRLESADMGEFTLWAVHGPHALLVCVIRGVPPKALRADLSAILERIHFRYGEAIRDYKGDTASVGDVEVELERCLRFEARRERSERKGKAGLWITLAVLLLAAAGFLGYRSWNYSQQLDRLAAALAAAPGIHVTDITRDGGDFVVRGLRDPLAPGMNGIAVSADIDAQRIAAEMQPFQSLQPEIISARARTVLAPPPSVQLAVVDTALVVTGDAPWQWRRQLENRATALAGISSIDLGNLTSSDRDAFVERAKQLDQSRFQFASGVNLATGAEAEIDQFAEEFQALQADAADVDFSVVLSLYGSTDSTGDAAANAELAQRRADVVAGLLAIHGVSVASSGRVSELPALESSADDARRRFVQIGLTIQSAQ